MKLPHYQCGNFFIVNVINQINKKLRSVNSNAFHVKCCCSLTPYHIFFVLSIIKQTKFKMKTSQLKSIFAFLVLAVVTFTSCKKDAPEPSHPIVGSWLGKYGSGNSEPSAFFSFRILPNGVVQVRDEVNTVIGTGTWKLDETTFTCIYTYEQGGGTYNLAAKYDEVEGNIIGSWGEGEVDTSAGDFYLVKQ